MRYILTTLLVTFISLGVQAQLWFDIGLKGSYGITMMMNGNVFDDRDIDHRISTGYSYGASLGIHFDDHNGILLEYMRSRGNQDFDDEKAGTPVQIGYTWNTNDALLLYRYSGYGAFFEIGPKVSFVSGVDFANRDGFELDVTDNFEDTWFSGVIGFGTYLAGSDLFSLQAGIRVQYQFGDMINDQGQANLLPVGVEYENYKRTSALSAMLHLEFNYAFGRFAKESCRDRWKLILFQ